MNFNTPPSDYKVLFLDMNSFFASVEQQVQPTLRGLPLGVAPYTGDSGCIIAASKEAKAMGIKIGRIGEAKMLCPKLKIVESRPALYMLYHKEIKKVIESFTPYFIPLSIDEFALFLTPREQNYQSAVKLGQDLKRSIKEKVGDYLTCSVGIGPSKFLAKMAGERRKPDGLTVVRLNELKSFYAELKLTDITGINWRMEQVLKIFYINSPTDFFNCSLVKLRERLNHPGRLWYFRLRGYEVDDHSSPTKTVGHSHVLPPKYRSREGAEAVIHRLIFKTASRLRSENFWAGGVSVRIGFMNLKSCHCEPSEILRSWMLSSVRQSFKEKDKLRSLSRTLIRGKNTRNDGTFSLSKKTTSFCDTKSLTDHIFLLLKKCRWQSRPIYVSISTFNLAKLCGNQISIFSEIEKQKSVSFALDKINDKYGPDTVYPASMHMARDSAPDRIPFGRPRYEILH